MTACLPFPIPIYLRHCIYGAMIHIVFTVVNESRIESGDDDLLNLFKENGMARPLALIHDPLSEDILEQVAGPDAVEFCVGQETYMLREVDGGINFKMSHSTSLFTVYLTFASRESVIYD